MKIKQFFQKTFSNQVLHIAHYKSPLALFNACKNKSINKVIHISTLGEANTSYFKSKYLIEKELIKIIPKSIIIRPSLIFGLDGTSTKAFLTLASLPIHFTPNNTGFLQPIHIEDLTKCISNLINIEENGIINACGPEKFQFKDLLKIYRKNLGLSKTLSIPIPTFIMNFSARIFGLFPHSILNKDSWLMLKSGSNGDCNKIQKIIGHELINPSCFIKDSEKEFSKLRSLKSWQNIFLKLILSIIWFVTAILSAFIYPLEDSLEPENHEILN